MASDPASPSGPKPSYQIRRATVDDLPELSALWRAGHLPVDKLEKHFTDFQVAADASGHLGGAVAMKITGGDGWLHSETFSDFALADTLRPLFWARLQSAARNHGLFRLWTLETAPFWKKDAGFAPASAEFRQKFPKSFGDFGPHWLALRLRDESAEPEAIERHFAAFKSLEQSRRDSLLQQAKVLRWFGTTVAVLLFLATLALLFWVARDWMRKH